MESIRVFTSCLKWNPGADEWMKALTLVQPEERSRIDKFVFKNDAKSAMVFKFLLSILKLDFIIILMLIYYQDIIFDIFCCNIYFI